MIKSERRTKARTILYSGALWLGGQTTVPAGSDLSAVTTLWLWGQATVPAGSYGSVLVLACCDGYTLIKQGNGHYTAGCRDFATQTKALAHWSHASRTDLRARTFAAALRRTNQSTEEGGA